MSNSVSFTNARIWRKDIKTENGEFSVYSVGVSSKNQDGSWDNAYLPVKFSKSANVPDKISNGTVATLNGFLTTKRRKDGKNEVQFMVMDYFAEDGSLPAADDSDLPDSFTQAEMDIPF